MSFYDKIYKLEKEENFIEFVEGFGLPEDKKKFLLYYKPNQKFLKDGDNYTQLLYINGEEKSVPFKVEDEFESTLNTMNVKYQFTIDGNNVTQQLKFGLDFDIVITIQKEFTDDKMVETFTSNVHGGSGKLYYSV